MKVEMENFDFLEKFFDKKTCPMCTRPKDLQGGSLVSEKGEKLDKIKAAITKNWRMVFVRLKLSVG